MKIFAYTDYRRYLKAVLPVQGEGRGLRAKLAKALRVQNAYISRVLAGHADFSLEQAIEINAHLQHSVDEGDYFVLLLLFSKAGTANLKNYFMKKIEAVQEKFQSIGTHVISSEKISFENQVIYYSNWIYSFLHLAFRVPEYQKIENWVDHFPLPRKTVKEAIQWMAQAGLIEANEDRWISKLNLLHLDHGSPLLATFHSQWRREALNHFDQRRDEDLFFTCPITISREDFKRIRTLILDTIAQIDRVIAPSDDEVVACLNIDLFRVADSAKK